MNEQSGTQEGIIQVTANEALTGLEGYLVKLVNDGGTLEAALPDAVTDLAVFVITEGAAAGSKASVMPLEPGRQVRVKLNGTCSPGDRIGLAAVNGTDDGKAAKIDQDTEGEYLLLGIAEEAGVDEQLLLIRPFVQERHQVGRFLGVLSADPSSPDQGDTWFNTSDVAWKGFDGTDTVVFQTAAE